MKRKLTRDASDGAHVKCPCFVLVACPENSIVDEKGTIDRCLPSAFRSALTSRGLLPVHRGVIRAATCTAAFTDVEQRIPARFRHVGLPTLHRIKARFQSSHVLPYLRELPICEALWGFEVDLVSSHLPVFKHRSSSDAYVTPVIQTSFSALIPRDQEGQQH